MAGARKGPEAMTRCVRTGMREARGDLGLTVPMCTGSQG